MTDLCIDTSGATTIALVREGEPTLYASNDSARHHAESIVPLIHQVLAEAGIEGPLNSDDIDAVIVGTGPAPFTGLRAGLVSARTIARAAGIPLYGVCSLDMIARAGLDLLPPDQRVIVATDARRHEMYWAQYEAQGPDDVATITEPTVGPVRTLANELQASASMLVTTGTLPSFAEEALSAVQTVPVTPFDVSVASRIVRSRLERGLEDTLDTQPLYLRRPDIHGQRPERM